MNSLDLGYVLIKRTRPKSHGSTAPNGTEPLSIDRESDTSFNHAAAELLRECAALLRQRNANPFRANAYGPPVAARSGREAEFAKALGIDLHPARHKPGSRTPPRGERHGG